MKKMKNWHKKIWASVLAVTAITLGGSLFAQTVLAAAPQIYLSPATASVQSGSTFTVALRINPGTIVKDAQAVVKYDASKLQYVSYDGTGSAFEIALGQTAASGSFTLYRGTTQSGTSVDSLVATFTFKALVGSGSTNLSLGANPATLSYDTNGKDIGASLAGATINFTTPTVQTCASNQTGTYPNCVTPVCPSGQTGTYPNCKTTTTTTTGGTSSKPSGGATTTPVTTTPTKTTPAGAAAPAITASTMNAQFSQASVALTSNVPTKAYIQYGLSASSLSISTAVSPLATTHTIQFDPTTLVPGQTYYYSIFTTDAAGTTTQTSVASFTLKGLNLKVGVYDQNHKPLTNATVTLHSTPVTVKTDSKGYLTFSGITPGIHHLTYVVGKKTYSQELQVINNIATDGATQSAPVQNFSVVFPFEQSSFAWQRYAIGVAVLVLIAIAVFIFIRKQRQIAAQPVLVSDSQVVTSNKASSAYNSTPGDSFAPQQSNQLNQIAGASVPNPGSTVAPQDESVERKGL